ncbi:hypothetical protein F9K33_02325 [bacterium]|nr:MAG: hypothetical protein F9K33_02325 [bacterium]
MMHAAKKIAAISLTSIYVTLALSAPFTVFHHHQMPVQDARHVATHELHDTSCDKHITAHLHLSDHCAACQFTSTKQSDFQYVWNLLDNQTSVDNLFFHFVIFSSQPYLSKAAGRAPPVIS